ncbi:MAG: chemotaxis protein CheA [Bdellovibrionaceae bacterium]|nr:chemotaxis protein CheA [Pseudobdellovibrionaceae bacterium]MBX3033858.1 chemotaxis protein CheA [Pseudobdellovibrionaceae bacterium]
MSDFDVELQTIFLEEAQSSLADTEQCFLRLEQDPSDAENLGKIFRLAHNLKGSSKAVGFDQLGEFTHHFETFILKIKNNELAASPPVVSFLLRCNDFLTQMIDGLKQDLKKQFDIHPLIQEMEQLSSGQASAPADDPPVAEVAAKADEPAIELSFAMPSPPAPAATSAVPAAEAPGHGEAAKNKAGEETIRVSTTKLENLLNVVGEMVILHSVLREQSLKSNNLELRKSLHQLEKIGKEIQDLSMSLRMLPIKPTFQKMQRIVRDTARAINKDIDLVLEGEETELDKTVLERIGDPLVHLVRNSVDHGIETADVRAAAGKNTRGRVRLSAYHRSGRLVIEVADDGGGLNPEKLKHKAVQKGLIQPHAQLSDREAWGLIFLPGFSTKEQVTEVSGRGVGMDVVKTNIQELGGEVEIESALGQGTTFRIILPLTLAIIEGLVTTVENHRFVIPLSTVAETLSLKPSQVHHRSGLGDVFLLRDENLPLFRLGDYFSIPSRNQDATSIVLVVRSNGNAFGLVVDDILGQNQIVVKALGSELSNLPGVSGSTILGDGKPSLIIEPVDLFKKGRLKTRPPATAKGESAA